MTRTTLQRIFVFIATISLLAMATAGIARGAKLPANESDEAAKAQAIKNDDEFNKAVKTKDRAALEHLLADDLSWIARGDRLDKAQVIADVLSENLHFKAFAHDNVVVKIFDNTAIMTGHSTSVLEYKGKLFNAPRLFTSVYMNLNGQWQLVAHQVSEIDPGKK